MLYSDVLYKIAAGGSTQGGQSSMPAAAQFNQNSAQANSSAKTPVTMPAAKSQAVANAEIAGNMPGWIGNLAPLVLGFGTISNGFKKVTSPEDNVYTQAAIRRAQHNPYVLSLFLPPNRE